MRRYIDGVERYSSLTGKGLILLLFIWFLWFVSFSTRTIFSPILPFIEDQFHVSHAKASSLFTMVSFGYGVSLFFSGIYTSLLGLKRSIVVSMAGSGLVFLLIPFVRTFDLFYALAMILGLVTGMYLPAAIPLITESYDDKIWGKVISIHDSAASMSIFAAPFIALSVLSFSTWPTIFSMLGVVSLVCAIAFWFVVPGTDTPVRRPFQWDLLRRRSMWLLGITWIFAAGSNLGLYMVLPLYLTKELMLDVSYANEIFGFSRLGGVAVSITMGFIVDRFSPKRITFLVVFFTGILTMALTMVDVGWLKVLLFVQACVAIGYFSVSIVTVSRLFDKETRGQATGFIVTLGVIFGVGIIPYLLGVAGDLASFRVGIFVLGLLTTLSSGLLPFLKELR